MTQLLTIIDAPVRRRLPPLLRKAWYGLNQSFRRRIVQFGTTPDQFTVLRLLVEGPPSGLSQRELCTLMSSDPNTVTALVTRMQERGLVERRTCSDDKRARRVTVIKEGKAIFRKLRAIALKLQGDILLTLPEERREQFLEDLETVAEKCRVIAESEQE
jgi:DNA-binding MarR family transcriptional regulator